MGNLSLLGTYIEINKNIKNTLEIYTILCYTININIIKQITYKEEDSMKKESQHKQNLQSYFKSLCDSFYIAYKEFERLSIKCKKLREDSNEVRPKLKTIQNILKIKNDICDDYITFKFSVKDLKEQKEKMESIDVELKESENREQYWFMRKEKIYEEIVEVIKEIVANGYTIIIESETEIYALIEFFYCNSVIENQIIDKKSKVIEKVNVKSNIAEEFFEAYYFTIENKPEKKGLISALYRAYFKRY